MALRKRVAGWCFQLAVWLTTKAFKLDKDELKDLAEEPDDEGDGTIPVYTYKGTSLTPEALAMRVEPKPVEVVVKPAKPLEGSAEARRRAVLGDWPERS